jgi:hypothetical protein
MTKVDSLDSDLVKSNDYLSTVTNKFEASKRAQQAILMKQNAVISALDRGENPPIEFYRGPIGFANGPSQLQYLLNGSRTIDLYKADAIIKATRGILFNPFFRYIFESRGIDIGDFSMDPTPGSYTRTPTGITVNELMKLEPPTSMLGRMRNEMVKAQMILPEHPRLEDFMNQTPEHELRALDARKKVCGQLKQLSLSSF